jgi:hypothetical protein
MSQGTYLLTLNMDSQRAVNKVIDRLSADGMQVIRSFDLQIAMTAHVACTCPSHGEDECDCQLVVLLVYDDQRTPLAMVAHGQDNKTHFALVDPPEHAQQRILKTKILQAVALEGFASILGARYK